MENQQPHSRARQLTLMHKQNNFSITLYTDITDRMRHSTLWLYHLIKILEVRPNQGKIRLAHILISAAVKAPTALQVEAKNKIDLVQKYLEKGEEPFELICKNYLS